MMGPWDTAPVQQEEEEIDMFAILGAVPPAQTVVATTNQAMAPTIAHDPLAAFMDDDEEETLVIIHEGRKRIMCDAVSYTHLRAHET